ncbi:hypothetical protein B0H63DRAFT_465722 [Podospora didyma]|uniref:RRN7-type domain-containing protein n=1 Tax=Podospora didyma TaxID=330526 RepID=A0AAE0NZ93_9PEZI|nr:hypothetical protein B0H63DRAFT_465722 [Podospora didyma]
MATHHDLRRFPHGETCAQCPAQRWYIENGRKFCQNGHQVEGFVQFDVDEADNFGEKRKINRKQKDVREKELKHFSGNNAKELYLECLQLILRKQIAWLVNKKDVHPELESVCRDIWDLRIRDFPGLTKALSPGEKGKGGSASQNSGSDGEMVMFSSQTVSQPSSPGLSPTKGKSLKSWSSDEWALPAPIDTLAIIYLGCVLRQEPIRIGDLYRWARSNQIPFLEMAHQVPKEWRERLPPWAQRLLLCRYIRWGGSELHRATISLMTGYQENRGMSFPSLPAPAQTLLYLKDLALPPLVYQNVQKTCGLLGIDFSFPPKIKDPSSARHTLFEIPEVQLVAAVVASTKLMYPLDSVERFPRDAEDPLSLKMDWTVWEAEFEEPPKKLGRVEFEHLEPDDIWTLSKEELNEFMNWFQQTRVDITNPTDQTEVDRLFPLQRVKPLSVSHDKPDEEIEATMKRVQNAMISVSPRPDPPSKDAKINRLGSPYSVYRYTHELTGHAKRFFEVAAHVAGLTVKDLVSAVFRFDMLMKQWEVEEVRRINREKTQVAREVAG